MIKWNINCKGLCLSGCENENENQELCELLKAKHPDLCSHYRIASDTIGSIMTCSPEGGIVLIAGTGSNSLLIYPDGSTFRCGGWGHLIGDMGSAYWIAIRMIKCLIENAENYTPIHYDTSEAEKILFDYFKIDNYIDLLKPLYHQFDKSHIAQFCFHIAKLANEKNDVLALKVFQEAGQVLAQHVKALLPKITNDHVSIICVGSVFKSWSLLERTFLNEIGPFSKLIEIIYLTETSAIGAAYFAAKDSIRLPIDHRQHYQLLCRFQNGQKIN
ncbi:hypothetical protein SSS_02922 [Sarcoptes scabiei]|nr:hypothetical protein SSS_02922 [Sarcoptes scabiei]